MKKRGKAYIIGPMAGIDGHNYPLFNAVAKAWRIAGWEVTNPAEMFDGKTDLPVEVYRKASVKALVDTNVVVALPRWNSPPSFAAFEAALARKLGIMVLDHRYPTDPRPVAESVLEEAQRLVYGDRDRAYGHPARNFERAGEMWGPVLECPHCGRTAKIPAWKVGLCLALLKAARLIERPDSRDGWVDLAGYAGTGARCVSIDP